MTTLIGRCNDMIAKAESVGWEVVRGNSGKHTKIRVPNSPRPVTIPGSPSSSRTLDSIEGKLRAAGLDALLEQQRNQQRQEARERVTLARRKADAAIDAANKRANEQPMAAVLGKKGITLTFETITPQMAKQLLDTAARATDFRQRPVHQATVDEYALEMKTGNWMEYLPDGVIGVDASGVLINGQKRMLAIIAAERPVGFIVARNVPRDMFPYFDMAQRRTPADTFAIAGLTSGADVQSAVRLAMRYESMLRGDIDRVGWSNWNKVRDQNAEALGFYERRPELGSLLQTAKSLNYGAKIVTASAMVFEYYANKAWPNRDNDATGFDPLESYMYGIRDGEKLTRMDPAYVVREWSRDLATTKERVQARRETFLFILMRYWHVHAENKKVTNTRITYGRSWPMPLPYHPDGDDEAVRNILK